MNFLNESQFDERTLVGKTIKSVELVEESRIGEDDREDVTEGYFEKRLKITFTDGRTVRFFLYQDV